MSATPSMAELLTAALDSRIANLHVAIPGKVTRYDQGAQLVDVQPQVKRVVYNDDGEKVLETLPVVPSVPLMFQGMGGYFASFPVQAGDGVLLVFCDYSPDSWMEVGDVADPGDVRMHGLGNAVAIPGLRPAARKIGTTHSVNMVLGKDGGIQIHISPTGVLVGGAGATHPMVLGDLLKTYLDEHIHPTAMGPSGPPIAGTPILTQQVLSTKHKVDG